MPGSEVGARNGQERVEYSPERAGRLTGGVRRLPQEPPTTRGNRGEQTRKNPNRERLGFHYWWRRRELNPRPKALRARRYMLVTLFGLVRRQHNVRGAPSDQPLGFDPRPKGAGADDPVIVTLHPRARTQVGSGPGLKRPGRRRRRSRLVFCHRINEEDDALGMLPAASRPPSKPSRPRGGQMVAAAGAEIKRVYTAPTPGRGAGARHGMRPALACRSRPAQAWRFLARITRCFSRFQSRSRSLSRLSCSCLPRATPRSSLTRLCFQYIASGTSV